MSDLGSPWQSARAREQRWRNMGQRPVIAWLTGLSGAGKSTIAHAVDEALVAAGLKTIVLDGDGLRQTLNRDLGFTKEDRAENIRRTAEVSRLAAEAGLVVIVSLISPFRAERAAARSIAAGIPFFEVFIDTPLSICETRDPKGLYKRARAGEIPHFTGISSDYEEPPAPDLILETQRMSVAESAHPLVALMLRSSAFED